MSNLGMALSSDLVPTLDDSIGNIKEEPKIEDPGAGGSPVIQILRQPEAKKKPLDIGKLFKQKLQ